MELRDFFAGAALTGMLSHEATELPSSRIDELVPYMYEVYRVADAMVAARGAKISEQGETCQLPTTQVKSSADATAEHICADYPKVQCCFQKFDNKPNYPPARYNMTTKYSKLYNSKAPYMVWKESVLDQIRHFVRKEKRKNIA